MNNLLKILLKYNVKYIDSSDESLSIPYGIWLREKSETIYADNKHFLDLPNYRVEFYFKDFKTQKELEERFEKELEDNDFFFSKSEDIFIKENIYQIYYEIQGGITSVRSNKK